MSVVTKTRVTYDIHTARLEQSKWNTSLNEHGARRLVAATLMLLALTGTGWAQTTKLMLFGGKDHTYLGCLNCSAVTSDSVCSQGGKFGSTLSSESIWNPYGRFGSKSQPESPWNRYATTDVPFVVDSLGNFYGYFSANQFYPNRTRVPALASLLDMARDNETSAVRTVLCANGQRALAGVPQSSAAGLSSNGGAAVMPECGPRPQTYGSKWDIASLALWAGCNATAVISRNRSAQANEGRLSASPDKVQWYRSRAEAGSPAAQFELGYLYFVGDGVPKDYAQALMWWRRSNQVLPEPSGDWLIAMLYGKGGPGLARDDAQAAVWFRRSAEAGYAAAQFSLGYMYAAGQGVTQDFVASYMWLSLAASSGSPQVKTDATIARDAVAKVMTPQQVAEGDRRALDWAVSFLSRQQQ